MPEITFRPSGETITVDINTKILAAAIRHKIDIRYGCAACQCGTCGIAVLLEGSDAELSPMRDDERALLSRMDLSTEGHIRLACQTRIIDGHLTVDLDFQHSYSPDQGEDD